MQRLLYSGFYLSPPFPWEDAHASHLFKGINYDIYLFTKNFKVLSQSVNSLDFDFKIFNERKSNFDEFKFVDNFSIEVTFNPTSKFSAQKLFTILSPKILLDEKLNEYHFKYTAGIDFNEQYLQEAIARGDDIWAASNPLELNLLFKDLSLAPVNSLKTSEALANYLKNLNDPAVLNKITGFGKETQVLSQNGYIYNSTTKMFIKRK